MNTPIIINGNVTANILDKDELVLSIITKLTINITGVINANLSNIFINCITWNASLVVLVIIDDIPNLSYSLWENSCDFLNISFLISLVTFVDILDEQYPNNIVPKTPIIDITTIISPIVFIYSISPLAIPLSITLAIIVGIPSSTKAKPNTDIILIIRSIL